MRLVGKAGLLGDFGQGVGATQQRGGVTRWVEQGTAPEDVVLQSAASGAARSMPVCVYPKRITYTSGDTALAASYVCS